MEGMVVDDSIFGIKVARVYGSPPVIEGVTSTATLLIFSISKIMKISFDEKK